ncbi:MAG: MlaE family ABC transporter permease [bacterium]
MTQSASTTVSSPANINLDNLGDGTVRLMLSGDWLMDRETPDLKSTLQRITAESGNVNQLSIDTTNLETWDSSLLVYLRQLFAKLESASITVDRQGLPENIAGLLRMSESSLGNRPAQGAIASPGLLERIGNTTLASYREVVSSIEFLGELIMAFYRFLTGRARFQFSDLMLYLHECGVAALPIVSLISIMVGAILAFVGAVQLEMFGAQIYVADLVAIGMTREMAALMTAVIMAGRTGSAFAAQLGTMQVNEEIDALKTTGLPVVEFLVFPRAAALILMAPLLYLYAVALGIFGGLLVGITVLDLSLVEYIHQTRTSIDLNDMLSGLIKSVVFAFVVAYAGCMRGMQCGRSSSAVGLATTSAMVTAIILIVVSDTGLTLLYTLLDF